MRKPVLDVVGTRHGLLTVVRRIGPDERRERGFHKRERDCVCRCACGTEFPAKLRKVCTGKTATCGDRGCRAKLRADRLAKSPPTRWCSSCKSRRPVSDFELKTVCRACQKISKLNAAEQYAKKRALGNAFRDRVRTFLDSYIRGCGCMNPGCPWSAPLHERVLDFHHKDPATKEYEISDARRGNMRLSRIFSEIRKCILLCANCHRMVHHGLLDVSGIPTCEVSEADFLTSCQEFVFPLPVK